MINFPCQLSRIHSRSCRGDGRVEVVADEPHIVVHGHFVAGVGFDITKRQGSARQPDVHRPARMGASLEILSQGGVRPGHP